MRETRRISGHRGPSPCRPGLGFSFPSARSPRNAHPAAKSAVLVAKARSSPMLRHADIATSKVAGVG